MTVVIPCREMWVKSRNERNPFTSKQNGEPVARAEV
jgi:hypothetical protein